MNKKFGFLKVLVMLITITVTTHAQTTLAPSPTLVDKSWKRNDSSLSIWYMISDTVQREIGTITTITKWDKDNNLFYGVQRIQLKNMPQLWIDSAVAGYNDLHPVYHSSYNMQRNMAIRYEKQGISGYYKPAGKDSTSFHDTQQLKFFDSNLYSYLINWLPLKEGYTAIIPIYEYNGTDHKVLNAYIRSCETYSLKRKESPPVDCWRVKVETEISPGSETVYYISKADRKTWLMEINAGARKMKMEKVQ